MINNKYKIKNVRGVINRDNIMPQKIKEYNLPRLCYYENTFKYIINNDNERRK